MSEGAYSAEDVKAIFKSCSNWHRWGDDDERGALNLITNETRLAAAALVETGESVALGLPMATSFAADNPTPVVHLMVQTGHPSERGVMPHSGDYFAISPHGFATTHLDALCHVFWEGKMYNGFAAEEVGSRGAEKCGIDVARDGIMSRGVLLDIPKIRGTSWIEPGDRITASELDAAEAEHSVTVHEGDVLLIRTGRVLRKKEKGAWDPWGEGMPGLDPSCLPWLHERGVAVLGSDAASDVAPSGIPEILMPIHVGALVFLGVHMIDNVDLEVLASTCQRTKRYAFQFTMAPLILRRGTASPVNPIAVL